MNERGDGWMEWRSLFNCERGWGFIDYLRYHILPFFYSFLASSMFILCIPSVCFFMWRLLYFACA